ncbi:MAG: hypothetical protein ACK4GN_07615 [Runella sp.]
MQKLQKNSWVGIFAIGTLTLLWGCESKQNTTQEKTLPPTSEQPSNTPKTLNTPQSELLRIIIGNTTGDFRGFRFGTPVSEIKAKETFEMFEDSTYHVAFTYETENFEAIDVIYNLDKNQTLSGIQVEVYLNDEIAVRNLFDQFDTYLSGKYTFHQKKGKIAWWRSSSGKIIQLEDVSKGKDFGIRLIIGPKGTSGLMSV